jgi:hypothetical protein
MPAPYYLKATNSDLTGGADFTKRLDADVTTQGTLSVAIAKAASEDSLAFTPAGTPGVGGGTGSQSWTVKVHVTTAAASTNIAVAVARVNSAGTQQSISAFSAFQSSGATGVKTFTLNSVNLGTWVAGDRLKVVYRFQNTHSSQTRTVVIATGTTNTEVLAPWAAPASLTPSGLTGDIAPGTVAPSDTVTTRTRAMGSAISVIPPNLSRVRVSFVVFETTQASTNMNPPSVTRTRSLGSLTAQWATSVSITGLSRA